MRRHYRYNRKTGKMEEYTKKRVIPSHYVMSDIKPYRSVIDGSEIGSRSTHRKHLKQHGCVEVGNEFPSASEKRQESSESRKRDIAEVLNGYGL